MVNWNETTEREMLLAIVHLNPPTKVLFAQAASMLGSGYTGEAVRQKYMKLKKSANTQWGDVETAGGEGKTPVKRGGGKKAAGEKTASGKRKAMSEEEV